MDLIYMSAEFTIIAAAGEDPSFGLPGVGLTARLPQPCVKVGRQRLTSSMVNPRIELENSKWMKRGWTYQEGLLSHRRLVFTTRQIYFQCRAMHCLESVEVPLKSLHVAADDESAGYHMDNAIRKYLIFPHDDIAGHPHNFVQRINEYSTRDLSFHTDVLNAILGVLKRFEFASQPVYQIWGVPILPTVDIPRHSLHFRKTHSEISPFGCKQFVLAREDDHFCRFGVIQLQYDQPFDIQGSTASIGKLRFERREFKIG
jgi:hypothetical protein